MVDQLPLISENGILQCPHGGTVYLKAEDISLQVDGVPLITQPDLINAPIYGCKQSSLLGGPCTRVTLVSSRDETKVSITPAGHHMIATAGTKTDRGYSIQLIDPGQQAWFATPSKKPSRVIQQVAEPRYKLYFAWRHHIESARDYLTAPRTTNAISDADSEADANAHNPSLTIGVANIDNGLASYIHLKINGGEVQSWEIVGRSGMPTYHPLTDGQPAPHLPAQTFVPLDEEITELEYCFHYLSDLSKLVNPPWKKTQFDGNKYVSNPVDFERYDSRDSFIYPSIGMRLPILADILPDSLYKHEYKFNKFDYLLLAEPNCTGYENLLTLQNLQYDQLHAGLEHNKPIFTKLKEGHYQAYASLNLLQEQYLSDEQYQKRKEMKSQLESLIYAFHQLPPVGMHRHHYLVNNDHKLSSDWLLKNYPSDTTSKVKADPSTIKVEFNQVFKTEEEQRNLMYIIPQAVIDMFMELDMEYEDHSQKSNQDDQSLMASITLAYTIERYTYDGRVSYIFNSVCQFCWRGYGVFENNTSTTNTTNKPEDKDQKNICFRLLLGVIFKFYQESEEKDTATEGQKHYQYIKENLYGIEPKFAHLKHMESVKSAVNDESSQPDNSRLKDILDGADKKYGQFIHQYKRLDVTARECVYFAPIKPLLVTNLYLNKKEFNTNIIVDGASIDEKDPGAQLNSLILANYHAWYQCMGYSTEFYSLTMDRSTVPSSDTSDTSDTSDENKTDINNAHCNIKPKKTSWDYRSNSTTKASTYYPLTQAPYFDTCDHKPLTMHERTELMADCFQSTAIKEALDRCATIATPTRENKEELKQRLFQNMSLLMPLLFPICGVDVEINRLIIDQSDDFINGIIKAVKNTNTIEASWLDACEASMSEDDSLSELMDEDEHVLYSNYLDQVAQFVYTLAGAQKGKGKSKLAGWLTALSNDNALPPSSKLAEYNKIGGLICGTLMKIDDFNKAHPDLAIIVNNPNISGQENNTVKFYRQLNKLLPKPKLAKLANFGSSLYLLNFFAKSMTSKDYSASDYMGGLGALMALYTTIGTSAIAQNGKIGRIFKFPVTNKMMGIVSASAQLITWYETMKTLDREDVGAQIYTTVETGVIVTIIALMAFNPLTSAAWGIFLIIESIISYFLFDWFMDDKIEASTKRSLWYQFKPKTLGDQYRPYFQHYLQHNATDKKDWVGDELPLINEQAFTHWQPSVNYFLRDNLVDFLFSNHLTGSENAKTLLYSAQRFELQSWMAIMQGYQLTKEDYDYNAVIFNDRLIQDSKSVAIWSLNKNGKVTRILESVTVKAGRVTFPSNELNHSDPNRSEPDYLGVYFQFMMKNKNDTTKDNVIYFFGEFEAFWDTLSCQDCYNKKTWGIGALEITEPPTKLKSQMQPE